MKTARRLTAAAMFFTALAFATSLQAQIEPAPAADPVLKAIPDDALGFVLVKNLGQTDKAISKLAATSKLAGMVQGQVPSVLSLFKLQAGIQEGLDENGSAAVALLPFKAAATETANSSPVPIVLLPVTDYKKFIAQFRPDDAAAETTGVTIAGHALVVGHKDSFAVFMLPDHKEQLAKVIASTKGVDSLLGGFEPWIGRHQVSVVATPTGSKMLFQAGAAAMAQLKTRMAQLPGAPQSAQAVAGLEIYRKILAKAGEEVDAFGVGLSLDESSNLSIDSHARFAPGGAWAAAIKDVKPAEGDRFAGIQTTPIVFAGQGVMPAEWADGLAKFSARYMDQMSKAGGDPGMTKQQRKDYTDAMRSMIKGMHSMSFIMAAQKPGEASLLGGITSLIKVDDASGYLSQYEKSLTQMIEITKQQKNPLFKFSDIKKIEVEGHAGLSITMDMSGLLAAKKNPVYQKLMPQLFGPDGKLTARLVVADDHTLISFYGDEERAKQALTDFKNPQSNLASDPDVATTLKLLPPHAQWVGLVSIKGYMDFIGGILSAVSPAGSQFKFPELPAMPPIGFAAEAGSGGLDTQMVLPAETIVSLSNVVRHATADESKKKSIEVQRIR